MKVILLKDVKGTGKAGDIIETSDGHARNFLIPKGLAKQASDGNVKELNHQQALQRKKDAEALAAARALAKKIESYKVTLRAKSGEGGRLFGSFNTKDVAEAMKVQHGLDIDKKKIQMDTIKTIGSHQVSVKVYPKVSAKFLVEVEEEA